MGTGLNTHTANVGVSLDFAGRVGDRSGCAKFTG